MKEEAERAQAKAYHTDSMFTLDSEGIICLIALRRAQNLVQRWNDRKRWNIILTVYCQIIINHQKSSRNKSRICDITVW